MTNIEEPDWNSWIRSPPKKKSLFKCFEEGTLRSSEDEEGVYTCECKDDWYGPNCIQKRPKFSTIFRRSHAVQEFSDDYKKCEEEPAILKKLQRSLAKAKKCKYIAGPLVPNGLLLGRFNIKWEDGEEIIINYLGIGENHGHDLNKIKKLGGRGGTILPSVFIEAAMASARVDDKCVDLFLEHPRFQPDYSRKYRWNEKVPGTNMISRLQGDVAPCLYGIPEDSLNFNYKSRMCKFGCKNVRIHETDIRSDVYHTLLPSEKVFGEQLWDLGWHLHSKLEVDNYEDIEDMLKFMLYEESMDERKMELVLYRSLAKHLAQEVYSLKHVKPFLKEPNENNLNLVSLNEWLKKPMLHDDYWSDFMNTKAGILPLLVGFLDLNETPSYTNWDKISQVAHRIATDIIYYRNAMKKLIRKREIALGARRSAQLRKAIIKVHNLLNANSINYLFINALSMDYYTLLRMLSPYDIKKRAGPCPTGILGGTQPRYIMMIAGNAHTINYAYVFRELAGLPINRLDKFEKFMNIKHKLKTPFRITNTVIIDKTKISEAGNRIKTGLDLINEWMEAEIPSPPQSPSPSPPQSPSPSGGNKCDGKKCPANKICNPKTGRCVKRNGKIGRQILANQSPSPFPPQSPSPSPPQSPSPSPSGGNKCDGKKCPANKICNPKTGRCVKRNGKIGRQILANQSPSPSPSPSPPGSPGYQYKNCRKYRKTKYPKCNDQDGCEWVVGTGCIRSPSR